VNKVKKSITAGLLFISLILIMADYGYFPKDHAHTAVSSNSSSGIADHFEHSHSHTSVFNLFCTEQKTRTTISISNINFIPDSEGKFYSDFISNIWQPPKLS